MMNMADGLKGLGKFNDAKAVLYSIPKTEYVKHSEYYYYLLNSITLSLSTYAYTDADKKAFRIKLRQCRDSLANVITPNSVGAKVNQAEIYKMDGKFREAANLLESIQAKDYLEIDDNAIYWMTLSEIYLMLGNTEATKYCLIRASIIDNRKCVKTYTSLQTLAIMLHNEGDIDHAYKYITRALDDIISSNARSRLVQVAEYMPIITAAHTLQERKIRTRNTAFITMLTILLILLASALIVLYKRNGKLSVARKKLNCQNIQLIELNTRLSQLNESLNSVNRQLSDANKIKEEYIAQLFDICSGYINDMERYRMSLIRKLKAKQEDEIRNMLNTNITALSLKEFFHKFDTIFLDLFPSFIEEFNNLLQPDSQITPHNGELLTPELRIYALVRLGINDSTKIANFLRYSSQTVYNYRMKVRNKAKVAKNEFAEYVQNLCR